jgi:hypothetical protein
MMYCNHQVHREFLITLYYNIIVLWDHRRICGPSLTEMSLCGEYLQSLFVCGENFTKHLNKLCVKLHNLQMLMEMMSLVAIVLSRDRVDVCLKTTFI